MAPILYRIYIYLVVFVWDVDFIRSVELPDQPRGGSRSQLVAQSAVEYNHREEMSNLEDINKTLVELRDELLHHQGQCKSGHLKVVQKAAFFKSPARVKTVFNLFVPYLIRPIVINRDCRRVLEKQVKIQNN